MVVVLDCEGDYVKLNCLGVEYDVKEVGSLRCCGCWIYFNIGNIKGI